MNAFCKLRTVLFGSVAVLALSFFAAPALAGGPHCKPHVCNNSYSSYLCCHTLRCYPKVGCYGNSYHTTCYPSCFTYVKPAFYPVTVYDCFGCPHIVYRKSFTTFVR